MTSLELAAHFAAYTWYREVRGHAGTTDAEAHRFAKESWEQFLPVADEGFGRLLQRLTGERRSRTQSQSCQDRELLAV